MAECSKRQKTAAECSKRRKVAERKENIPFGSNVSKVVEMMNDISHGAREIFLWELVREAIEELYQMRREVYFDTTKIVDPRGLFIEIILDKSNRTLSMVDNGIGKTEDDLNRLFNLPEISVKTCEDIIDKLKKKEVNVDEFYVRNNGEASLGFFAAYMVADKVEITTKHYGGDTQCTLFSSPRDNLYLLSSSVELCTNSCPQGFTKVTLHLNEDHFEYLDERRLKVLIDKCSFELCPYPISIRVLPGGNIIQRFADVEEKQKDMKLMKRKFEGLRRRFRKVLAHTVKRVVVSDRMFDIPTNLSLDGKTLEINPRSSMMEKLRQEAECDPEGEEVVGMIGAQFMAGVCFVKNYDVKHKTNYYQRVMKLTSYY